VAHVGTRRMVSRVSFWATSFCTSRRPVAKLGSERKQDEIIIGIGFPRPLLRLILVSSRPLPSWGNGTDRYTFQLGRLVFRLKRKPERLRSRQHHLTPSFRADMKETEGGRKRNASGEITSTSDIFRSPRILIKVMSWLHPVLPS